MSKLADFPYYRILVLGLAKSGTAAARALLQHGKQVRINDKSAKPEDRLIKELEDLGAEVFYGDHPLEALNNMEIVVKNPGISYDHPIVREAISKNIPVITEVELAYYLTESPIIGITGSNGKTTTTTLITKMIESSGIPVKVAGNIGIVATDVALSIDEDTTMVLELSSFQLQGTEKFRPNIAVLLNIYEAHLDYHKTFENYTAAKCNIFKNQTEEDYVVFNADDPIIMNEISHAKGRLVPFSVKNMTEDGAYISSGKIYFRGEEIIHVDDVVLVGNHNLENILAAVAAAKLRGAENEAIRNVLATFSGVKHRLQYVETIEGRKFYNDSKATNILATQKALASFTQPVILLAGGLDRGNEFTDLIPYLKNVKGMVLFGQTKGKLQQIAEQVHIPYILAENVEQAAEQAFHMSVEGDVILLSPACASWDQYRTFEERGDMFIQAVHRLM
ncbi:UDP-N-acetylmuramoylalanine--D-glutamate ligase [Compostibacillus humi]|uniref:UDP-N-acetylmuramoylalanine--D-glutamate ligase n=1 Tax=Compostibacillus humi TaxID=1245525 RepID=A0A8J2ZS97_9BACI|nr:UDP-N-acetylmuramoyl-L-alanine--D-glutamate ligase [Compostibacillus humi]GGH73419.1 UDP-N-acetylmuramoylalanine--D-glutamate ligase [Compostibacillus humi]